YWVAGRETENVTTASGHFERHADGRQECHAAVTETDGTVTADGVLWSSTTPTIWSFRAAFKNAGTTVAGCSAQASSAYWMNARVNSTTEAQLTKWTGRSTESTTRATRAWARGFWY